MFASFKPFAVLLSPALLVIEFLASAAWAADKQPVPAAQAQAETTAVVKEIYDEKLQAAKTPDELASVASGMLQDALATDNDPTGRYVLLKMAGNLAARAGDAELAIRVVNDMDRYYVIDALNIKSKALLSISGKLSGAEAADELLPHLTATIDEAVQHERFDTAMEMLRAATATARKARDTEQIKSLAQREVELGEIAKVHDEAKAAMAVLDKSPTDPTANSTAGRYQCFYLEKWDAGIPMLVLGADESLKKAALAELAAPTDPAAQVDVGDRWWDLAEQTDDRHRAAIHRRAVHWYETALPRLDGLLKKKVEQRLEAAKTAEQPDQPASPKRYKYALEFSGSQYVRCNLRYSGKSAMTLEAIVKRASYISTNSNQAVLGTYYYTGMGLMLSGNRRWGFLVKDSSSRWVYSQEEAQLGQMVHLAGVYTGRNIALFVNGKLQGVTQMRAPHKPSDQPIGVGAYPIPSGSAQEYFQGQIVAVRITSAALYKENFTPHVPFEATKNTVLLLPLEEGEGNKVTDLSPRGNHGIVVNPRWVKLAN